MKLDLSAMPADASTVPPEQVKELSEMGDMHQRGGMAHHDENDKHTSHEHHGMSAETSDDKLSLREQLRKLLENELINDYAKHSETRLDSMEDSQEQGANSDQYEQFLSQLETQFAANGRRFKAHGPRGVFRFH
jgi:hypothetical protein